MAAGATGAGISVAVNDELGGVTSLAVLPDVWVSAVK
jgi:hypothetical protein